MLKFSFNDLPTLRQLKNKIIIYGLIVVNINRKEFDFELSTEKSAIIEDEGMVSKNNNINAYKK